VKIGGLSFIDGSIFSLDPTLIALQDIAHLHGGPDAIALAVSLGSGSACKAEPNHEGTIIKTELSQEQHQEYAVYERFNALEGLSDTWAGFM
jgi:hypothetical protein